MTERADEVIATLDLPLGVRLELTGDGRFAWLVGDRPVTAGDGIAALIADMIESRSIAGVEASVGEVRVEAGDRSPSAQHATVPVDTRGPLASREAAIPVDQTNLSVVVDGISVVKLVGAWGSADRAAGILGTLQGTGITPSFRGALRWRVPGHGESTIAMSTEFVRDASDGWTWAVDDVLAWHVRPDAPDPMWPAAVGELTGRLHAALGASAEVVTISTGRLVADAHAALRSAMEAVRGTATGDGSRAGAGAASRSATAARLAAREPTLRRAAYVSVDSVRLPIFTGHGDLHVGQMLRRPSDDPSAWNSYRLIDFDGAPQTVSGAPEPRVSGAVDLAHLLTSIDLVASIAQRLVGSADPGLRQWAERARGQATGSYLGALQAAGVDLTGDDRVVWAEVVATAEVEQFAREMLYAHKYLPRWLYAPDGAVAARFASARRPHSASHPDAARRSDADSRSDQEDPPWTPPVSLTISD